ncbi:uncharacterized protein Z518_10945 [Rhinocladiella mackenziei CBS 650.93]|uniref:Carrier domain-containing protein n=1 Tax=Rhinocladiella mackenziei CBS 650.93 TaxID=1442369 RepID=A0A0D2GNX4_9EURO|nr:uncharacterized protein Z518_10945 [Rhinocladiella mackenziei CBS 650.93]KIX00018.1 hypothetical protein Z518_10945 [Rhinocladiella mackenziei CBS 650.93]
MALQALLFALFSVVLPLVVVYLNSLSKPLRGIELVGPKPQGWTSWKAGETFNSNGISILQEGLKRLKNKPFQVLTHTGPKIILPPCYVDEIKSDPRFSLDLPNDNDFFVRWPAFSPQAMFTRNHTLIQMINSKLTPSLTRITAPVNEENELAVRELFPPTDSWNSTPFAEHMLSLTTRTSSRVFVGLPMCRDPVVLTAMRDYSAELVAAAQAMMKWPLLLRPFAYLYLPEVRKLSKTVQIARRCLGAEIARRVKAHGGRDEVGHLQWSQTRSLDAVEWLRETVRAQGKKFDLVGGLLSLAFGAIHTTSHTLTHVMYDIIENPDLIPQLRQEIIDALREDGGWKKTTLYKLKLLDSVMKESQRVLPVRAVLFRRVTLEAVCLKDGTELPRGVEVNIPNLHMRDEATYGEAGRFNGARFLNLRSQAGNESKYQYATTGVDSLGFGHGQHARPGRFFATLQGLSRQRGGGDGLSVAGSRISSNIDLPEYSQSLCTVVQVALVDLLSSWNVNPVSVVGHSSGEIAAAYCIGAISKQAAWKIAYHRGILSSQLKSLAPELEGAMMAVGASETQAQEYIQKVTEGELVVACVNSPSSVTISGDAIGIRHLTNMLEGLKVFHRRLKVNTAYHSPHMHTISSIYMHSLSDVQAQESIEGRQMFSSVIGDLVDPAELGAMNWVRNLVSPVLFTDAVSALLQTGPDGRRCAGPSVDIFVEIGPHPALRGPVNQIMDSLGVKGIEYRTMLHRGQQAVDSALTCCGDLHVLGVPVNIEKINDSPAGRTPRMLVDLPPYVWNHSRTFWGESRLAQQFRLRKFPSIGLLGAPYPSPNSEEAVWRGFLRIEEEPWIEDHQIQSSILYPAAGYLAMAIEAARQLSDVNRKVSDFRLRDVIISSAVVLKEGEDVECVCQLRPHQVGTRDTSSTWWEFTISTCVAGTNQLKTNCTGLILVEYCVTEDSAAHAEIHLENKSVKARFKDMENDCTSKEDAVDFYKELAAVPKTGSVAAQVQNGRPHIIHPATLDAIFHLSFAALKGGSGTLKEAMVPTAIDEVIVAASAPFHEGARFRGFSTAAKHGMKELKADIVMLDEMVERPLVRIRGFTCAAFSGSGIDASAENEEMTERGMCSKLVWKPCLGLLSNEEQFELFSKVGPSTMTPEESRHFKKSEYLALMFMRQIVDHVKWSSVAPEQHLRRLYEWMKNQQELVMAGKHQLQHTFGDDLPDQIAKDANSEFHSVDSDDQKLYLTATILTQILLGQLKAERLMLEESLLDRYLSNTPGVGACANKLAEVVDMVLFSQPSVSILEFGGASGGVAAKVLSRRRGIFTNYTYACPTEAIKGLAEETLKPWSSASKFLVDDLSAAEQRTTDTETYDIIIAANALYGVESIENVLVDLKRMLNPGGRLCLIETTRPGIQLSCALGCFQSWWRKGESAAMDETEWRALLNRIGFESVIPYPDFEDETCQQFSLMVAQAPDPSWNTVTPGKEFVIVEPRDPTRVSAALGSKIALELTEAACRCSLVKWGDLSALQTGGSVIVLAEVELALLPTLNDEDFSFMQSLILKSSDVLWVSSHDQPTASMASGLARSVRNECANIRFRILQAMPKSLEVPDHLASHIVKLTTYPGTDSEFVEKEGILNVSRAVQDGAFNEELSAYLHGGKVELMPLGKCHGPQKIHVGAPGMLDSLQFEADDLAWAHLQPGYVEIEVKATGINFRDVMVAMGQIPDSLFGFEASGVITQVASDVTSLQPGQRVSCLGHGAHRTHYRSPAAFCQLIPDDITFEEAAGLPLVHATAYHALVNVMRVQKGQSILIHAAAGGVGQAAIQLAQHYEMEIFTTVGSADKRALLQEVYGIPDDHIFHSRDASFAKALKRMTGDRGVDCILNSLAGEQLRQTWHCIAPFGTFVEIGLKDILGNTRLDMRPFIQDATFSFLNLQHVAVARPELMASILKETFDLLRRKVTRPVYPLTAFPISDMENAFRIMQAGRHRGKLVLTFSPEDVVKVHRNPSVELKLKANGTYVLVGGFGGIGNSLARLLVEHGARHICILSRSGPSSDEAKSLLVDLKKQDAIVRAYCCDITNESELEEVLQICSTDLPPIRGVFQCAMVLRDVLFENMSHQHWTESIRPKVQGTWNLHQHLPKHLDFFIILSSFAGVFGNRGQANYAAAGAYEDAFAQHRRSLGLKAVSIDLGIMRDVGVLATGTASASRDLKDWEEPFGIRQTDLHALIRKVMESEMAGSDNVEAQILTGFATGGGVTAAGIRRPFYYDDPRFSVLEWTGYRAKDGTGNGELELSLKARLTAAVSLEDAYEAATRGIVDKVANMMQTSVEEIDSSRPLHTFGVDSLVAVEIRNWLTKEAKADVTVFDILAAVPITAFARTVVSKSALVAKR